LISPSYHFSSGVPREENPFNGGVEVYYETNSSSGGTETLGVYAVFKFYVRQDDVHKFFQALPNKYASAEYDIIVGFTRTVTSVLSEVMSNYTCADYMVGKENETKHELDWIDRFTDECQTIFNARKMPFTLDGKIRAVLFFNGCGFREY